MSRNILRLDTSGFTEMLTKLDNLGGNVKAATVEALTKASETITRSTENALENQNLPAHGKYSTGATKRSIIRNPEVEWDGDVASIPVGFDFSKPGAGGYLITGTPRMQPDRELNRIYKQRRYMAIIQKGMEEIIMNRVIKEMTK
ncbi:MAG: hypothetical protein K6F88_00340 [Ruminococcus sp.]|nr:hypothetical protein [Ruminococcus sp.]